MHLRLARFLGRHLDAGALFGESMYGLVMVLTATLGAGLHRHEDAQALHALLMTAIGCNIAWGLIDGAMYIMGSLLDRGRRGRMLAALQAAGTETEGLRVIADALDERLSSLSSVEERASLYRNIQRMAVHASPPSMQVTRDDWLGAAARSVVVMLSTLPATIPFLVLHQPLVALRCSNAASIAAMGVCGYFWAGRTGINRWKSTLAIMSVGIVMVGIAMAL